MDLAELYIEVLMRGHIPVSPEVLDKFQQVGLPARLVDIVYQRHFWNFLYGGRSLTAVHYEVSFFLFSFILMVDFLLAFLLFAVFTGEGRSHWWAESR